VGDDELGELIRSTVAGQRVATAAIVDPHAPTGLMIKERRTGTLTRVRYYRSGSAGSRLTPDDLDRAPIAAAQVVHVTGITPALSRTARDTVFAAVALAREHGVPVSVDLNYRRALWGPDQARDVFRDLARRADILLATEDEGRLLVDADEPARLAAGLAALGPAEVLVKLGERGAAAHIDDRPYPVPPRPVTVLDPVGAGDAFAAGYLASRCRRADAPERLAAAATAGAFAVTVAGDWEGAPTAAELGLIGDAGDAVSR
jgi:2-dehydro-3-deoxygluconokinase